MRKTRPHVHSYQTLFSAAREAYFIDFADQLRLHLGQSKIAVTGGFRTTRAMAEAINLGSTDGQFDGSLSRSVTDVYEI